MTAALAAAPGLPSLKAIQPLSCQREGMGEEFYFCPLPKTACSFFRAIVEIHERVSYAFRPFSLALRPIPVAFSEALSPSHVAA